MNIAAVIVTYNRLELLKQSIICLKQQTRKLDKIYVINNASTDGTDKYLNTLSEEVEVVNLPKNLGGAGGFQYGIRMACEKQADYVWIMDDDTLAEPDALENLLHGIETLGDRSWGVVACNVLFKDNTACLMNIPENGTEWNELLVKGIVRINCSSFVGMLVKSEAVKKVGLPIREFFIWGDDVEYSKRIINQFGGYMIGDSIVKHYMAENQGTDILIADKKRIARYFYAYRNHFYMAKKRGFLSSVAYLINCFITMVKILLHSHYKARKCWIIIKGCLAGLFFNPKIEFVEDREK